jgi:GTP-binding protein
LIPADAKDLKEQYRILLGELQKYNPELLDKRRLLAISKSDMLDEQLIKEMEKEIPTDLPHVFISSVTQFNLDKLKDLIWQAIQS